MASMGLTPTLDAFMTQAKSQSRSNWRAAFTADGVAAYIRAGFGVGNGSTRCPADLNGDGVVNINDVTTFLNLFIAGDPRANCDGSVTPPVLNANDLECFLNELIQGCH
jgi:hypothetical protein